jgi:hypothetical protein
MSIIDKDGRLFGRVNLFDAAIGAFVILLLPLSYAAVLLFRTPTPEITSVEAAPLTMTEDRAAAGSELSGKVKVRGRNLRPVLRAEIGDQPALAYIFENPSTADVLFGNLKPGSHDLVLFDGRQEVARAAKAITIPEQPFSGLTRVHAVGTIVDLDSETARRLHVGQKFPETNDPEIEIVALGEPIPARYRVTGRSETAVRDRWQRDAMVMVRCQINLLQPGECRSTGRLVAPGQVLSVTGTAGSLRLNISHVLPDQKPEMTELRVRFLGYAGVVDLVKAGDRDRPELGVDGRGAVITSLGARRTLSGQVTVGLIEEGKGISAGVEATDQVASLDAVVSLGLDRSSDGWRYRNELVRAGSPLTFTTPTYTLRGIVLSMRPEAAHAAQTNGTQP